MYTHCQPHSHPDTELFELFAVKLQQWQGNGLKVVLVLPCLLESFMGCLYSHLTDQSLTPVSERGEGPPRGQKQKKRLGVSSGPTWEGLSQALCFFLTGFSSHLQEVQLPLIPLRLCQLLYGHTSYLLPDMICAGDIKNKKTACEVRPTVGTKSGTLKSGCSSALSHWHF